MIFEREFSIGQTQNVMDSSAVTSSMKNP